VPVIMTAIFAVIVDVPFRIVAIVRMRHNVPVAVPIVVAAVLVVNMDVDASRRRRAVRMSHAKHAGRRRQAQDDQHVSHMPPILIGDYTTPRTFWFPKTYTSIRLLRRRA
jgi:competence transcription factor ComK